MWNDMRQAIRLLFRERAFAAAAILTLALGIGANVAVFAVVEAVLLRPLPYESAERLVHPQSPRRTDRSHQGLHRDGRSGRHCRPPSDARACHRVRHRSQHPLRNGRAHHRVVADRAAASVRRVWIGGPARPPPRRRRRTARRRAGGGDRARVLAHALRRRSGVDRPAHSHRSSRARDRRHRAAAIQVSSRPRDGSHHAVYRARASRHAAQQRVDARGGPHETGRVVSQANVAAHDDRGTTGTRTSPDQPWHPLLREIDARQPRSATPGGR